MCICINCYFVDRCLTYHAVETQHQERHLTEWSGMWWVVKAFYAKPVNGLVCGQVNQFPPKTPELPIHIYYKSRKLIHKYVLDSQRFEECVI